MLSEGTVSQGPAQHLRASPRRCSVACRYRSFRAVAARSQAHRDEVRALEAYLTSRPASAAWPARRTGRVRARGHRPEPQTNGEADHLPAAALHCPRCRSLATKSQDRSKLTVDLKSGHADRQPAPYQRRLLQRYRHFCDIPRQGKDGRFRSLSGSSSAGRPLRTLLRVVGCLPEAAVTRGARHFWEVPKRRQFVESSPVQVSKRRSLPSRQRSFGSL
jgi:hypothetical protein